MPRKTRMYLPGVPVHVVQRGNNRQACFFCDADYESYKSFLAEGLRRYGATLHAYCLMTNHVHLLMTPAEEDSISRVIQHLGRQYVQYINKTYRRTGTLWEGRHKGSLVDSELYVLSCYRYIELNPVKAKMVACAEDYRWSSFQRNGCGQEDLLLTSHDCYEKLGVSDIERLQAYKAFVLEQGKLSESKVIQRGLETGLPTGSDEFGRYIEQVLGRKLGNGKRGRPAQVV